MYEWDAKDYHEHSSEQQKWAEELIGKIRLDGSERVLDIGCGDGKVTAKIAGCLTKGSILGIDSSGEMICFAQKNYPADKYRNLAFMKMDARYLDFDNDFDVVFSNATLHWIINHQMLLKNISRSLKHGGRLFIQMGGKGNAAGVFDVFESMFQEKRWKGFFDSFPFPYGFYGVEEYRKWLKNAGLKALRVELIPKDMIHQGKKGLSGWIRTTWIPYTQRLPEELQEEFISQLADRYIDEHPADKDGFVHIAMVRLEVEAEKKDSSF